MDLRSRSNPRLPSGGGDPRYAQPPPGPGFGGQPPGPGYVGGGGGFPPAEYPDRGVGPDRSGFGASLDPRTHRSRSLDLRRELEDDVDLGSSRNRFGSQALVPVDRQGRRNYEYDREYHGEDARGFDARTRYDGGYWTERGGGGGGGFAGMSPRSRTLARSQEWYPKGAPGGGSTSPRGHRSGGGMSPRSADSSGRKHLSISVDRTGREKRASGGQGFSFGRKDEPSPRSGVYSTRDDFGRNEFGAAAAANVGGLGGGGRRYEQDWSATGGGGAGGGGHRSYYSSGYHHERQSAGGAGNAAAASTGGGGFIKRAPPTGKPLGPGAPFAAGGPQPPRRHYKVRCCCFSFTWPPWSLEPVEPPQPLYTRNI